MMRLLSALTTAVFPRLSVETVRDRDLVVGILAMEIWGDISELLYLRRIHKNSLTYTRSVIKQIHDNEHKYKIILDLF